MEISLIEHALQSTENLPIGWIPELYSDTQTISVPDASVIECRISGLDDIDDNYDRAVRLRCDIVKYLLQHLSLQILYADLMPRPSTRTRTHKGVFPYNGTIYGGGFEQVEVFRTPKASQLVGLAPIDERNVEECCRLVSDRRRGCFLINRSRERKLEIEFVGSVFSSAKLTFVNLPFLIRSIGRECFGFATFGGDQGVSFVNMSLFSNKNYKDLVSEAIRQATDFTNT